MEQPTTSQITKFTVDNYKSGFLVDEDLMAGISEDEPGIFTAFVVRHTTGETLGVHQYHNAFEAIRALNDIPRNWVYESVKRCGGGNCGNGKCGTGGCGAQKVKEASSDSQVNAQVCAPDSPCSSESRSSETK